MTGETRARRCIRCAIVASVVVLFVLLLSVTVRRVGRRRLFPGHEVPVTALPSSVEQWELRASDGVTVRAMSVPVRGSERVVVHFHNNRETMVEPLWLARGLADRGVSVLVAEYRGYGLSRGEVEPTEEGIYLDAEAVLDEAGRRGFGPERIVLWGTSLGSGVAAEMALRRRGAALVLVSPYTSIPDLVRGWTLLEPPDLLLPDRFDTGAKCARILMPTLVIHGDADEIVPFAMGAVLTRTIPGAELLRVPSGRHGDLFLRAKDQLLDRIGALGGV